jgi:hypothetical protein
MAKFLKIFLIVFLILILMSSAAGYYFYNFFVFKTLRVCITEETFDSQISCNINEDCYNYAKDNLEIEVDNLPPFITSKIDNVISKSIHCEKTCRIKEFYGDGINRELGSVKSCSENEEEIIIEIRGKEGFEILKFLKKNKEIL